MPPGPRGIPRPPCIIICGMPYGAPGPPGYCLYMPPMGHVRGGARGALGTQWGGFHRILKKILKITYEKMLRSPNFKMLTWSLLIIAY